MSRTGRYLYAVIDADRPLAYGDAGIDGAGVYTIDEGGLAAVVSDVPDRKVRPERRKLAAHYDVLRRLLPERTLLPMAFGLIADGEDAVRAILSANGESFRDQLRRFDGKVEMGVRASLEVPNVFGHVVAGDPELTAARDALFAGGRKPSQDEMIDLGRMFEASLGRLRAAAVERLAAAVAGCAAEVKELAPRSEKELFHVAVLIPRGMREQLEAAVADHAAALGDEVAVDLNGPWPPHNFIEMHVGV